MELKVLAKLFGVLGPLIACVGAGMLAYDIFRGPVRWFDLIYFPRGSLNFEKEMHKRLVEKLSRLAPPYTQDQVNEFIAEQTKRYEERIVEIEEHAAQKDYQEKEHSLRLALWGFGFVAIGSLFQAVAAILS